jgi:hypothetical protein
MQATAPKHRHHSNNVAVYSQSICSHIQTGRAAAPNTRLLHTMAAFTMAVYSQSMCPLKHTGLQPQWALQLPNTDAYCTPWQQSLWQRRITVNVSTHTNRAATTMRTAACMGSQTLTPFTAAVYTHSVMHPHTRTGLQPQWGLQVSLNITSQHDLVAPVPIHDTRRIIPQPGAETDIRNTSATQHTTHDAWGRWQHIRCFPSY